MKIYGILIQNKGCIGNLGLFRVEKKARQSWEVLEKFHHQAVFFEYNLQSGKGKELAGMNHFPDNLVFFKKLTSEMKLKVS